MQYIVIITVTKLPEKNGVYVPSHPHTHIHLTTAGDIPYPSEISSRLFSS